MTSHNGGLEPDGNTTSQTDVATRLAHDGAMWREHLPFTSVTAQELLQKVKQSHMHGGQAMESQTADLRSRILHKRPPLRRVLLTVSAVLVITVGGFMLLLIRSNLQQPSTGFLAPPEYRWIAPPNAAQMTAQQAFAAGVTLTPCGGKPPQSTQITWIATNAPFGLAVIQISCQDRRELMLFAMKREGTHGWIPEPQYLEGRPASFLAQDAGIVPAWLPLPANRYLFEPAWGAGQLPLKLDTWSTVSQFYMVGQLNETVTVPDQSTTIQVDGHPGFIVQSSGVVTCLVPLGQDKTFVVVGTASSQDIAQLASAALPHLSELP